MNNDSLVSINIFHEHQQKIINKIPLLFYWNGEGDLLTNIFRDESFIKKYLDKINLDAYKHLQLAYFYFTYDENDEEQYVDNIINIFDYLDLSIFDSKNIVYELIIKHMFNLYKISMGISYDDTKIYNDEIIIDIYNQIKSKYQDKLNKNTFLNWIRNELIIKEELTNNNTNFIIEQLKNILISIN